MNRVVALVTVFVLVAVGCASGPAPSAEPTVTEPMPTERPRASQVPGFPPAPLAPDGPLDPAVVDALDTYVTTLIAGTLEESTLDTIAASKDPRLGWVIADLLRFLQGSRLQDSLLDAFAALTGVGPATDPALAASAWGRASDLMIAWDVPAPPGYQELKAQLFVSVGPDWEPFFSDLDADIDWRHVSWGGVFIDDRPLGATELCERGCIPALDDPPLTPAAAGRWYPDERIVFGIVVGDEVLALPRNVMEVHEMMNITLGGRRLGIPYCTLCGSAQAYFTDSVPSGIATPILRTSGLLVRSNKVMYDLVTRSVLDTFTGRAVSGPLHDAAVVLEQATVVVTTWGEWKAAHPETMIVASDGGIGRSYPLDPLQGRDDAGPIFPIGGVDPRLPVQANVVGVVGPDGVPVAFPVQQARSALKAGREVSLGEVVVEADGGGLRVRVRGGDELPAHQAFWFAWSQFHPTTLVWTPLTP